MSITFFVPKDEPHTKMYDCQCDHIRTGQYNPKCHDCKGTGVIGLTLDAHSVNMSMSRADHMLQCMGLSVPTDDAECFAGDIPLTSLRAALSRCPQDHEEQRSYWSQMRTLLLYAIHTNQPIHYG